MKKNYPFSYALQLAFLSPFSFYHPKTTLQNHKNLCETELGGTMLFYSLRLKVRTNFSHLLQQSIQHNAFPRTLEILGSHNLCCSVPQVLISSTFVCVFLSERNIYQNLNRVLLRLWWYPKKGRVKHDY